MIKKAGRFLLYAVFGIFFLSVAAVVMYKYIPVRYTPLMAIRATQQRKNQEQAVRYHHWVPLEDISANMVRAVIASEDQLFFEHKGFDKEQIKRQSRKTLPAAVPGEPVPSPNKRQKTSSSGPKVPGSEKE